jgi:hypothetical protein
MLLVEPQTSHGCLESTPVLIARAISLLAEAFSFSLSPALGPVTGSSDRFMDGTWIGSASWVPFARSPRGALVLLFLTHLSDCQQQRVGCCGVGSCFYFDIAKPERIPARTGNRTPAFEHVKASFGQTDVGSFVLNEWFRIAVRVGRKGFAGFDERLLGGWCSWRQFCLRWHGGN